METREVKPVPTISAWLTFGASLLASNAAATSVVSEISTSAPENTLVSFRMAVEKGAPWFELDCTLSMDNEAIVIHDLTLDRTTDLKGRVDQHTLAELKKADAGIRFGEAFKGEGIPTLGESLDFAKGRIGVYIEIKNSADDTVVMDTILARADAGTLPDRAAMLRMIEESGSRNIELVRRVVREVRARKMEREVVIHSFSPVVCAVMLAEAPDLRTEFLAMSSKEKPEQWPWFLRWLDLLDPHGFNPYEGDVTKELIDKIHARGKSIAAWVVDEEADMRRFAEWGVDLLITDKPDVALAVLKDMAL